MLFDGTYARGPVAEEVSAQAWLCALLEVEGALARACAAEGEITADAAERIAAVCADAERFDVVQLAREGGEHATVVVPLVRALRAAVGERDAPFVHLGATSQDVLDSAAMLVARRALTSIEQNAGAAAEAAARLADAHRATPMSGRTLLQQALPVSFGLRAAGWTVALDGARAELARVRSERLAVQLGGPVGMRGPAVAERLAGLLELRAPVLAWHTARGPVIALAGALGELSAALGKVARDVSLLAQNEIGELREGGGANRGGSSAMAHKRNPVAAVSVLACTRRVPGLVATLLAAAEQEHERAAGAWQAEWGTLADLLMLTGSAAAWGADLLGHLEVDEERMRENLGRLASAGVSEAADPERRLGAADELIDRALAAHRGA